MARRMPPRFCALILLGLAWCFIVPLAQGAQILKWDQIRRGMNVAAVVQAVGAPLFKTGGKVYQTWIYDRSGEILIAHGVVIAVSTPK